MPQLDETIDDIPTLLFHLGGALKHTHGLLGNSTVVSLLPTVAALLPSAPPPSPGRERARQRERRLMGLSMGGLWRLLYKYSAAPGAAAAADVIAESESPKAEAIRRLLELTRALELTDIDFLPDTVPPAQITKASEPPSTPPPDGRKRSK